MAYKIDLFAIFIFLGIVQALFLSFFFFSGANRKIPANIYQGMVVLAMAACTFEILLCYTGYIINCLWLVDFSEWIAFLIAPSFYLMLVSFVRGRPSSKSYWHFAVAAIWLLMQIPFFLQPADVKFNAWIGAYHTPGLVFRETHEHFFKPSHHSDFVLIHLAIYAVLGLLLIIKIFHRRQQSFWLTKLPALVRLRATVVQAIIVIVLIFIVKLLNRDDMGDHLFAAYMTVPIYLISFQVIRESGFFRKASLIEPEKYKTSSLTPDLQQQLVKKLNNLMGERKPFLRPDFSLPELAGQMNLTVHQLSQVINDGVGKSFFELTAEYRIDEAKRLLREKPNIKIEEIAEEVGYNSKSSFNTAFKKLTGHTPGEWRAARNVLYL
ncbi:MAG: AraC family transcriptional regulator [Bacteroidetes bacterium]|nr:AraC family transcriptional regulator [Bacteroidota bacterium]MBS1539261.1 AraC family transcriptional regulator [Bacteroidota bacterium]